MSDTAIRLGVDVGASLAKFALAVHGDTRLPSFELLPSTNLQAVANHVRALEPTRVGLTGGGAARLLALLDCPCESAGEFDAWGAGAMQLLPLASDGPAPGDDFLLVSLGTGTGIFLVQSGQTKRVGGTGIGGGAVVGLGRALAGVGFKKLCALAERGDSAAVDLRVSDVYGDEAFALAADLTAANFGKLAREASESSRLTEPNEKDRADRAAGIMRLVGETVALICAGLSATTAVDQVVYGGSTLRQNPCLVGVLTEVTALCGLQSCFLPHGGFAGAVGALEMTRAPA